jgi:SAM-dependent methyltransferase
MPVDIVDLRQFYATALGHVTRRVLSRVVRGMWPSTTGLTVVGVGYAAPCLAQFRGDAQSVLAFMPAAQGVVNWPSDGPSATALVDSMALPLSNASVDRILLLHAIEAVSEPLDILNEAWRVLTPGGRLIVIAPNRRGLWARRDATPFGHGQPYSRNQLAQLLRLALFSPETWTEALYLPPTQRRMILRISMVVERFGERLSLPFPGVHVVDATKQLYRPAMARSGRREFVIAAPAPVASREVS